MNIGINVEEKEYFSVEDIVSYSNIEITHVNDNHAPAAVVVKKVVVWLLVLSMLGSLFLI